MWREVVIDYCWNSSKEINISLRHFIHNMLLLYVLIYLIKCLFYCTCLTQFCHLQRYLHSVTVHYKAMKPLYFVIIIRGIIHEDKCKIINWLIFIYI
jgi:hypothetical protein